MKAVGVGGEGHQGRSQGRPGGIIFRVFLVSVTSSPALKERECRKGREGLRK